MKKEIECRYRCGRPVTHFCPECRDGYYCEAHARRHDRQVEEAGGSVFCKPFESTAASGPAAGQTEDCPIAQHSKEVS